METKYILLRIGIWLLLIISSIVTHQVVIGTHAEVPALMTIIFIMFATFYPIGALEK